MTIRNPYACHPLLRKGGPHVKSRSGQRRQVKDDLWDEADEYMLSRQNPSVISATHDELDEPESSNKNSSATEGGNQPPFLFSFTTPTLHLH